MKNRPEVVNKATGITRANWNILEILHKLLFLSVNSDVFEKAGYKAL